jgi:ABC-type transport system involved in multi-copper enzyme maturation permease subunit
VVKAVINYTTMDSVFIGMTATDIDSSTGFDEIIENPAYTGFSGGRDVNFLEIRGFLTFELFGWWWMLVGFFLAYMAVAMVANDFTEKRMDLIFSTPLPRERYLLEKFLALTGFSLFILVMASLALVGGVDSIGYSEELDAGTSFLVFIGCLPFLMVIASVGILTAVVFRNTRVGMGLTFMFILFEFIFYTLAGFSKDLEWFRFISIMEYWDYRAMLLDGNFNVGYFIGLFVASFVILGLAIYIFKKRDIPA